MTFEEFQKSFNELTLDEVEERLSQIQPRVEARSLEDGDFEQFANEIKDEKRALVERKKELEELELRKKQVEEIVSHEAENVKVVEERGNIMENVKITVASPEYRDAFYAMIGGNMTDEHRAVLASPISVDGNGTADGQAIALPKSLDEKIWDNIHTAHPILDDISYVRSGVVMEVTKHTAIATRVTSKKDGAATAGAEENTFVKVTLAGKDYEKYVELTYAEAKMSQGALEDYLAQEIADELGEALAKDVFAQVLSDATTAQKVTATADLFADIKSALALATMASQPVIYAPSSQYYEIVGAIKSGSPFNIANTLGCQVKKDDAATKVTVLDPKMFLCNEVQSTMIETERDVKAHRVIVSGYLRAEGCLRKNKAAAYIA